MFSIEYTAIDCERSSTVSSRWTWVHVVATERAVLPFALTASTDRCSSSAISALLAGAAAALAVGGTGAGIAATKLNDSPSAESKAIVDDAAKQLGVQPSELSGALKKAMKDRVAGLRAQHNYFHSRRKAGAKEVVAEAGRLGAEAIALRGDVARDDDVQRLIGATLDRFGRVDILVNNAGVMVRGPLLQVPEDRCRRMLDINVTGTIGRYHWCKAEAERIAVKPHVGTQPHQ